MPGLECLRLGGGPCPDLLVVLQQRDSLPWHTIARIFHSSAYVQVTSLGNRPTGLETTRHAGDSAWWGGCAWAEPEVGETPAPKESTSMVTLSTFLRIFPWIETTDFTDEGRREADHIIFRSEQIVDFSSEYHHLAILRNPR